jgi:hypothetical protein
MEMGLRPTVKHLYAVRTRLHHCELCLKSMEFGEEFYYVPPKQAVHVSCYDLWYDAAAALPDTRWRRVVVALIGWYGRRFGIPHWLTRLGARAH